MNEMVSFFDQYIDASKKAERDGALLTAIAYAQNALKVDPLSASGWLRLGYLQKKYEQYNDCITSCRRAIELDCTSAEAYTFLGNALTSIKKHEEAVAAFTKSLELHPAAFRHILLAYVLSLLDRKNEAERSLHEALRMEPDNAEAFYNLALLLPRDRDDEAVRLLQRAIQANKGYALAYEELGKILLRKKHFAEAEDALRKAITLDHTQHWAHLYLAILLSTQNQNEKAEAEYIAACETAPLASHPWWALGDFYRGIGRLSEAERSFREAVQVGPNDPEAIKRLGEFLFREGHREEGKALLDEAKRLASLSEPGMTLPPQTDPRNQ